VECGNQELLLKGLSQGRNGESFAQCALALTEGPVLEKGNLAEGSPKKAQQPQE
jgi:hypothetical protein